MSKERERKREREKEKGGTKDRNQGKRKMLLLGMMRSNIATLMLTSILILITLLAPNVHGNLLDWFMPAPAAPPLPVDVPNPLMTPSSEPETSSEYPGRISFAAAERLMLEERSSGVNGINNVEIHKAAETRIAQETQRMINNKNANSEDSDVENSIASKEKTTELSTEESGSQEADAPDADGSTGKKTDTIADQFDKVLDAEFGEDGEAELEKTANQGRGTFNEGVSHGDKLGVVVRINNDSNSTSTSSSLFDLFNVLKPQNILNGDDGMETSEQGAPRLLDENDDEYVKSRPRSGSFELQSDIALVRDIVTVMVSTTMFGLIAYMLSQPPISGFLIGGSIVGPGGFGIVNELVQVETVAQLGVIFLLMTLGMEFKLNKLKGIRSVALLGGTVQIVLLIGICGLGALLVSGNFRKGIFLGTVISMSSTTVVLQCLTERGQTQSTFGSITIGTLILQDIAVGILFALLPVLGKGDFYDAVSVAAYIVLMLMLFVIICWFISRFVLSRMLAIVCAPGPSSVGLQHAFVVAMGLIISAFSDKLGLSLELGAFASGVMISTTEHSSTMLHAVEPIRNVFLTLFLGTVGMVVSVKFIFQHIAVLLLSVIIVSSLKTCVIGVTVKAFGYPWRTSLGVGAAMAQIGEFSFVLLGRARELDIIEGSFYLLLLGSTALSLFTTPLGFKYMVWPITLGAQQNLPFSKNDCFNIFTFRGGRSSSTSATEMVRKRGDEDKTSDDDDDDESTQSIKISI